MRTILCTTALALLAFQMTPAMAQETKINPAAVQGNQDTGRQHIQLTPPPAGGNGDRPAQQVQPQIDSLKERIAALEAMLNSQKAMVTSLSNTIAALQQENQKLEGVAAEYKTHTHRLNNSFGFTQQGNMKMVTTLSVEALERPTSGPMPGK